MCDVGPQKDIHMHMHKICTRTKVRSVRINFRPMQFHLKSTNSNSGHAKPAQTRLPHSNRAKQNRPCTITFKSNKPKQNQIKMVRSTSFRPPHQAGSKQFNAIHIRLSFQFQTFHTKSCQDSFDWSLPSMQRAGELEYLPCSAHKMHKVGHVGPQKDPHIDNIGHFGPHTHAHLHKIGQCGPQR